MTGFARFLQERLTLPGRTVARGQALLYALNIAPGGSSVLPAGEPAEFHKLHSFQTDLLIGPSAPKGPRGQPRCLPRVVVELKWGGLNTHDALTYSAKAHRHKEIYPYLRYGIVFGNADGFTGEKFLNHNWGFDFAAAYPAGPNGAISDESVRQLTAILNSQLEAAERLVRLFGTGRRVTSYESRLEIVEQRQPGT